MLGVVGTEHAHPPVLRDVPEFVDGRLRALLVEAGGEVEVEDVVAEALAAGPGLHPREVDVSVGERLGDYIFHFDFAAGLYEERAREAVEELRDISSNGWVRVLGSYDTEHVL